MISLRLKYYFFRYNFKRTPAFCVHDICWTVFLQAVDHAPLSQWHYMMASSHQGWTPRSGHGPDLSDTLLCEPEILDQGYMVFLSKAKLSSHENTLVDEYLKILLSIRNLSTELRRRIWRFLDAECWTRRVLSTLSRIPETIYMRNVHAYGPSSSIQLGELKIYSYSCERMGISYLGCVHVEPLRISTSGVCSGDVEVPAQINTIETITGYFGASSVRFYVGQAKTPWLGKPDPRPRHRWHRFIKNENNSNTIHFRRLHRDVWFHPCQVLQRIPF
jgi:hypothetical protein